MLEYLITTTQLVVTKVTTKVLVSNHDGYPLAIIIIQYVVSLPVSSAHQAGQCDGVIALNGGCVQLCAPSSTGGCSDIAKTHVKGLVYHREGC